MWCIGKFIFLKKIFLAVINIYIYNLFIYIEGYSALTDPEHSPADETVPVTEGKQGAQSERENINQLN